MDNEPMNGNDNNDDGKDWSDRIYDNSYGSSNTQPPDPVSGEDNEESKDNINGKHIQKAAIRYGSLKVILVLICLFYIAMYASAIKEAMGDIEKNNREKEKRTECIMDDTSYLKETADNKIKNETDFDMDKIREEMDTRYGYIDSGTGISNGIGGDVEYSLTEGNKPGNNVSVYYYELRIKDIRSDNKNIDIVCINKSDKRQRVNLSMYAGSSLGAAHTLLIGDTIVLKTIKKLEADCRVSLSPYIILEFYAKNDIEEDDRIISDKLYIKEYTNDSSIDKDKLEHNNQADEKGKLRKDSKEDDKDSKEDDKGWIWEQY